MTSNQAQIETSNSLLKKIIGGQLSSVQFVMDYLILGFDVRGALTTLVWPEIIGAQDVLKYGMVGYRDRLCELICKVVSDVEFTENETINIGFGDLTKLSISLASYKGSGERAIFTAPPHVLYNW